MGLTVGRGPIGRPYAKQGATDAPLSSESMAYRFLPAFFFPPFATVFFAMALIPPFARGCCTLGAHRLTAPLPSGTPANDAVPIAIRVQLPRAREGRSGKVGVPKPGDTPGPVQAASSASSRP